MVISLTYEKIHGRWARLVDNGKVQIYQMKPEDVIQLDYFTPTGTDTYLTSMTYKGIKITPCWKIYWDEWGLHLHSEGTNEFIQRDHNVEIKEEALRLAVEKMGQGQREGL